MKITIRNLMATAFIAASFQTHAQGTLIYDQQSATNPIAFNSLGVDFFDIQPDGPLTQSFTPTLSTIGFVQFEFIDPPGNGSSGATVYVNLWTGSPNINSATLLGSTAPVYMPNGFGYGYGVTNFYFSTPIALTAGQTYYLQPVVQSGDNPWDIMVLTNTYPNGQLFANGFVLQPGSDFWFREGVMSVPEPSTLALIGLSGILAYTFKRRSKLFILLGSGILLLSSIHAQQALAPVQDSVVQAVADEAGLTPVSATALPCVGTFWVMTAGPNGSLTALPYPVLPANLSALPTYSVVGNSFIVDDTGGQTLSRSSGLRFNSAMMASAIQLQANTVASLIAQIQFSGLNPSGGSGDTNGGFQPNYTPPVYTNGLWLETLNEDPTNLWLRLHGTVESDNYQLLSTTNLLNTNWDLGEIIFWADGDQDDFPSAVPMTNSAAFFRAHHANPVMALWDNTNSIEPSSANNDPGQVGAIGVYDEIEWSPVTNDMPVYYTISGTAQNGIDYSNITGVATIPVGQHWTFVYIQPLDVGLKPDRTIVLTLVQNTNYLIDPPYLSATNILYANSDLYPIAYGDRQFPCPNTPRPIQLNAYDPRYLSLNYTILTWPTYGTLDTNDISSAPVTYTPTNCYEGQDSFTFTASDGQFTSAPATVTLFISSQVYANPVSAPTCPGQPVSFSLSGGDSCGEGVSHALPSNSPHGILNTNALPYVTYTPTDTNFTGVDSFNYIVTSGCGGDSATATVTLYVAGGPSLMIGCNPFAVGPFVPLDWFLGTNELQMQQQLNCISDYKIYRSAVSGGPYACIYTNTDLSQTSYMDTNVVAGQTNYYVVTFEFIYNSTTYESPFSNEIKIVVPNSYNLIPQDAIWTVWDVSYTNRPPDRLGDLRAPFSSVYPNQYPTLYPWPNTYWPSNTMWSNNIVLVIPTNIVDLSQVKYSIAIDNDYWLYVNGSNVDTLIHDGLATWASFKTLATNVLHQGTNNIGVVIRDRGDITYFSMVVTTNTCGQ